MTIAEWKKGVLEFNTKLNQDLMHNDKAKELFYGFEVLDGKIIQNPLILFIGINPGRGNGKRHYSIKFESEKLSYLDVFNEDYREDYPNTYHLAEKTIKFFREMGWSEKKIINVLKTQTVKTNFYHIATDNGADIRKTLNFLGNDLHKSYFQKSAEFTMQLIDIIKPKLVILEGKGVFDNIIVECCEQKGLWNSNKFGDYYDKKLQTQFIGYDRTFSNECRTVFVNRLEEFLNVEKLN